MSRHGQQSRGRGAGYHGGSGVGVKAPRVGGSKGTALFDPSKSDAELFDALAEKQADSFEEQINSSQLRRFFGEVKELYRRYDSLTRGKEEDECARVYARQIEPLFKMIRSKVAYASRQGGQSKIPEEFAGFLSAGVDSVKNHKDFRRFVMHFEAVVGFMYGNGKVSR